MSITKSEGLGQVYRVPCTYDADTGEVTITIAWSPRMVSFPGQALVFLPCARNFSGVVSLEALLGEHQDG